MSLFSDFKKDFYNRIGDGSLFDCGQVNLLKVVLDGLHVRYADKGPVNTPLFGSLGAHKRFLFLRRTKMRLKGEAAKAQALHAQLLQARGKEFLVVDLSGRFVLDDSGRPRSLYYDRVLQALGRSRSFFVLESGKTPQFPFDLHYPRISRWLQQQAMSAEDQTLRQQLRDTYSRISGSGIFSARELANIRVAFQLFFDYYRAWYAIVAALRPRVLVFDQHYHREGLLLAMKRQGVHTVELQHGLIAEEDIFPDAVRGVIRRALFADRILVYGEFLKQRLLKGCEYPEQRIGTIGYYHFESTQEDSALRERLQKFKGADQLLLVTTQTNLHSYFIACVEGLAKDIAAKKLPWKIVVKPHPAEKKGIYDQLEAFDSVKIVDANLEQLFPLSDLHLSIYSTTLFDAIRFGVKSYAVYIPEYGDYVDAMIAAGVAERTEPGTDFLGSYAGSGENLLRRDHYYSTFMPEQFLHELEAHAATQERVACSRCILTTDDDPALELDGEGVCRYCRQYERDVQVKLVAGRPDAAERLKAIVEKIKKEGAGKRYDCILGVSGGVDSTYLAYVAGQQGLRPLLVHFDNGWNSELAVMNIESIAQKLGFDLFTYVIDWEEFRDLQVAFLKASVVDIELLTDHAISAVIHNVAKKYGIRYILSGANIVTEGVLPPHWVHRKSDWLNIRAIHKLYGKRRLKKYPKRTYFDNLRNLLFNKTETVDLLNYVHYDKEQAKATIISGLGWRDYGGKHYESIFTRFYQSYILPTKFGIDKRRAHLSTLICSGQLTRDEALRKMEEPICDPAMMASDKEYVIKKLGLSETEFAQMMELPVRAHTSYPSYINKHWKWQFAFLRFLKPLRTFIKKFR